MGMIVRPYRRGHCRGAIHCAHARFAPIHRARGGVGARPGELVDVVFGYAGQPILHHVSLAISPASTSPWSGRTGPARAAPRSSLLGGLYEPWEDWVEVLGRNPRELAAGRPGARLFGVVPQTALLFNGTVLENVALFDPSVSREMAEDAVRLAGAEGFVETLPHGYETLLAGVGGGRGMRHHLPGRRRCWRWPGRWCWTRRAVLLDEATAAIDAATEAALAAALRSGVVGRRRGLLTVAHPAGDGPRGRPGDRARGRPDRRGGPPRRADPPGRAVRGAGGAGGGWDWRDAPPER